MSESTGLALKNGILLFLIILVVHVILKNAVTERAVTERMEQQLEQRRRAQPPLPSQDPAAKEGGGAGVEEEEVERQGPEEANEKEDEAGDDDDLFRYVTDAEKEKDVSLSSPTPPQGPAVIGMPANIALGGGLSPPPVPSTASAPPWQDDVSELNGGGPGELRGLDSFEQFNFAPLSADIQSLQPPGVPRLQ